MTVHGAMETRLTIKRYVSQPDSKWYGEYIYVPVRNAGRFLMGDFRNQKSKNNKIIIMRNKIPVYKHYEASGSIIVLCDATSALNMQLALRHQGTICAYNSYAVKKPHKDTLTPCTNNCSRA